MALCINREFSLQLQGITLCNYRYLYSAANTPGLIIWSYLTIIERFALNLMFFTETVLF